MLEGFKLRVRKVKSKKSRFGMWQMADHVQSHGSPKEESLAARSRDLFVPDRHDRSHSQG